jgi:MFS family permease
MSGSAMSGSAMSGSAPGLWAPEQRGLTTGLVLSTTFIAAEALAVITILPRVAADLGGIDLYGWVFSAFMLGSLVGTVAAGREADRVGPARPFLAGIALFVAGLAAAGLAPSMGVLVAGRVLQGLGAGAIPAVAYVAIGHSLAERQRAQMMAVLSTAWVVPALIGPAASAEVTRLFGWRVVFIGLIPLVAVAGMLALPTLVRIGRPAGAHATEHRLVDALRAAAGSALLLQGLASHDALPAVLLLLAGLVVGLPALRRLLPPGTLSARRGLPATILSRGLLTFAFFGADAFVTLAITTVLHHSTTTASVVITGSTLAWTAGAWLQARLNEEWEGRRLIFVGVCLLIGGIAGMIISLHSSVPIAEALLAWSVAGFGMGLAYAPTSLMMLRETAAAQRGRASASLTLSEVLGIALGTGLGGAAVAAASQRGWSLSTGVTIALCIAGAGALLTLAATRRLPLERIEPAVATSPLRGA